MYHCFIHFPFSVADFIKNRGCCLISNKFIKLSKEKNKKIIANAKATLAIEGLIVTESETKILEDYLEGIITEKDVLKIINSIGKKK